MFPHDSTICIPLRAPRARGGTPQRIWGWSLDLQGGRVSRSGRVFPIVVRRRPSAGFKASWRRERDFWRPLASACPPPRPPSTNGGGQSPEWPALVRDLDRAAPPLMPKCALHSHLAYVGSSEGHAGSMAHSGRNRL